MADGSGEKLESAKDAKDSWTVDIRGSDKVVVTYRVYAFRHNTNQSYLDSEHAVINGASVFLYLGGHQSRARPRSRSCPSPVWKVVTTGLEPVTPGRLDVRGPQLRRPDRLAPGGGEPARPLVRGAGREARGLHLRAKADRRDDLRRGHQEDSRAHHPDLRGGPLLEVPLPRRLLRPGMRGLEHLNSTHCIANYYRMEPPGRYQADAHALQPRVLPHWNVKRMRPKASGPSTTRPRPTPNRSG